MSDASARPARYSVVIPAYNAARTIGAAVAAALAQDLPPHEVIVVDDGSRDATAELLRGSPARCIRQENAGPAAARNAGWKASGGEAVLFTDADCVPRPDWARRLLEGFADAEVGAVTGSYGIANPGCLLPRLIHEEIRLRHRRYASRVRFFGSYNVALRRGVLEATGGFDESYRRASAEDNDLSYRVLAAGSRIAFAPAALVDHHHTERLRAYLREQATHGYWRVKLYRDNPSMMRGDDYTRAKDILEPPLALATLAAAAAVPLAAAPFPILAALLALLQLPSAVGMARGRGEASYLWFAPLGFVRSFARGLGMAAGAVWGGRLPRRRAPGPRPVA